MWYDVPMIRFAQIGLVVLWLGTTSWLMVTARLVNVRHERECMRSDYLGTGPTNHAENWFGAGCLAAQGFLTWTCTVVVARRRGLGVLSGALRGIPAGLVSAIALVPLVGLSLQLLFTLPVDGLSETLVAILVALVLAASVILPLVLAVRVFAPKHGQA